MANPSLDELARRRADNPDDRIAAFDYASALDAAGREAEAVPVYRQALTGELPDRVRYRASVQLGSSLRVIGEVEQAVSLHRSVVVRWPDGLANRLFLALALEAAGQSGPAVGEAISVAVASRSDPDLDPYRRALAGYAQELAAPR